MHTSEVERLDAITDLRRTAYETLRDAILTGALAPGATLSESRLGEALGMSRSPVRTALEQLVADRLVTSVPRKGYFVAEITAATISEVMQIRDAMECFAICHSDYRVEQEALRKLREAFLYYSHLKTEPTATQWAVLQEADRRFHETIVAGMHNSLASDVLNSVSLLSVYVRSVAWSSPGRFRVGALEHVTIIDAILDGRPDEARQHMQQHLFGARDFLLELMYRPRRHTPFHIAWEERNVAEWLVSSKVPFEELLAQVARNHRPHTYDGRSIS